MSKDNGVNVRIAKSFFDNIFEPARRDLEKETGVRIGQVKFTEFLAKKNIKLRLPKQKINIRSKPIRTKRVLRKGFRVI